MYIVLNASQAIKHISKFISGIWQIHPFCEGNTRTTNDIYSTTMFLEQFMENLLTGAHHDLKNRYMHIDYSETSQSANSNISKCKNCTLEELAILREISNNPSITQKLLAEAIGKSERTVKSRTADLQNRGLLRRKNGKRSGQWEVLVEV